MSKFLLVSVTIIFLMCLRVQAQTQTVTNGSATTTVTFPGVGCKYKWVNNTPGIGLAASGTGDIASFTAINTGTTPIIATIVATPTPNDEQAMYIPSLISNQVFITDLAPPPPPPLLPRNGIVRVGTSPYGVAVSPNSKWIYVSNRLSNNVSVISAATYSVIATVTVGTNPEGIVVSPDGNKVYVANYTDDNISIINTTTNAVIGTINVGLHPSGMVMSPDGGKLYVSLSGSNNVMAISTVSNSVTSVGNTGSEPLGLAINPVGTRLYVANNNANNITVLNTANMQQVGGTITVGSKPFALAMSSDGTKLYASLNGAKAVAVVTVANNSVANIPAGTNPTGLSFSPDGTKLYVINNGSDDVSVISTASNSVSNTLPSVGLQPFGLGNFTTGGQGCNGSQITFTITVNPTPPSITAAGTLAALTTGYGVPSPSTSFTVSGLTLPSGILVSPPAGFEVSADNVYFSPTITVGTAGNVAKTTVYIRLSATTAVGSYGGNIVFTSGATSTTIATANSTVTAAAPTIILSGGVSGVIKGCAGTGSASPFIQKVTVSAINLTAIFNASVPSDFEVSLSENSGYASNVSINTTGGTAGNTIVYIRSSPTALGQIAGNITFSSPGAVTKTAPVNGYVFTLPTIDPVSNQTAVNKTLTNTIKFTGTGNNTFNWFNDNPDIGLAASGSGDILPFTAVNPGTSDVVGIITAYPVSIPLVYCANLSNNSVSAINPVTKTVAATITVGSNPWSLAVTPDGSRVYVANYGSNNVSVINTSNNKVIATLKVGNQPKGISISADGSRVSVYNLSDDAISIIDVATNTVISTIAAGNAPPGSTVSPDGSKIYTLSVLGPPRVIVLNASDNSINSTILVGDAPVACILNADGSRLYVSSTPANTIAVINTATNKVITTLTTGKSPQGMTLNGDESKLYVANGDDNNVSIFDTKTYASEGMVTVEHFPTAMASTPGTGCSGDPVTFNIVVSPTPPTIIADDTLNALTTQYGTPSPSTTFNLSAFNAHGPILVTPPAGFEVSLDGVTYNSALTVGISGDLPVTKIYVRLAAATPVGNYSGDIVLSSADATSVKVPTVNSSVTESIPTIITGTVSGVISACLGTPSASPNIQRFTVLGSLLVDNIIATAPPGFEVSLSVSSGYSNSISLTQVGGKVATTTVYVRSSSAAPLGSAAGNIVFTASGAITRNVGVKGSINALPVISAVADQTLPSGATTKPISFTGTGNTYVWTNDKPIIGLAANGSDDIAAFTAVNGTGSSIVANITATPISAAFAYVATQTSNSVSVINTGSNKIIKTITVGTSPYATAVSPDGARVYVTNQSSGTVSIVSTITNAVIASITVGSSPSGVVVNLDGSRLYVTNQGSKTVSVVNTVTSSLETNIPVGLNPEGIALSADGTKVYVVNRNSTNISVINTSTNSVITNITVGTSPEGIAVSRDGNTIYVTNYNARSVSVVNATTYAVSSITVGTNPRGVAVSADGGLLYVANNGSASVSVINTTTNQVVSTIPVGQFPQGICASPDGTKVFVANYTSKSVSVINTATNTVTGTVTLTGAPVSFGNFITGGTGCSGDPIKFKITVDPSSAYITATGALTALSTNYGTPSASGSFSVSGTAMTAPILVTPPAGYEVSTDNINFRNTVSIGTSGNIAATTVYVRLAGSAGGGKYAGDIVLSSAGAANVKVPTVSSEVSPIQLTVTADNKTKVMGRNNPVLTVSYNGFVNNDTASQLTIPPQITTTANLTSPIGTYPITAAGAASPNYTIVYVDGILTVTPTAQSLVVPNAFTPNGDGTNDTWVIKNLNTYPDVVVKIFNRSGQNIFLSNSYAIAWDGRYNGADLPTGTYYYIINVSGSKPLSGAVAIIR